MVETKYKFIIVSGDEFRSMFMQYCDVFEKGKVLGDIRYLTVTYEGEPRTDIAGLLLEHIKETLIKSKQIVSFVHLLEMDTDEVCIKNVKHLVPPYFNKDVRMISNGKQWGMFHHFIKSLGLQCKTNQFLYIESIP